MWGPKKCFELHKYWQELKRRSHLCVFYWGFFTPLLRREIAICIKLSLLWVYIGICRCRFKSVNTQVGKTLGKYVFVWLFLLDLLGNILWIVLFCRHLLDLIVIWQISLAADVFSLKMPLIFNECAAVQVASTTGNSTAGVLLSWIFLEACVRARKWSD